MYMVIMSEAHHTNNEKEVENLQIVLKSIPINTNKSNHIIITGFQKQAKMVDDFLDIAKMLGNSMAKIKKRK